MVNDDEFSCVGMASGGILQGVRSDVEHSSHVVGIGAGKRDCDSVAGGVALVSNHRLAQYQEELLQEAFPVSEAVRGVLETVMRLTDRQHEMMTSTSYAEFARIPPRLPLEQSFRRERHNLDKLLERFPSSRKLLGDLDHNFDNLLYADTRLAQTLDRLESAEVRSIMSRTAINALLETSLLPLGLHSYLMTALRIIRSIPWLRVWNNDIAIFLVDKRESEALRLVVHIGFSDTEQRLCAQMAPGYCLCGTSLASGQIVFADDEDERHVVDHPETDRHGHYCIPILSSGRPLGVLTLHLDKNHRQNPDEIALLTTIAHTLAGVIERKRMEEHLQHLAHHDPLTGLPNRTLFREHAEQLHTQAIRSRSILAVILLDLDRFKQVNDTLGHAAGDQLLLMVTHRIKQTLRASDLLARLGGDEFGLVIEGLPNALNVAIVAEKIVHSLVQPFMIQETSCAIGVSIGIALFPEHGDTVDMLLERADQAMYAVKQNGRNGFRYARLDDREFPLEQGTGL